MLKASDRVETAVGFVGEDVGAFNGFKGDSVVKLILSSGSWADLMEGLFKVHHVINVGHFLVLSEEFGVDGFAVGGGQTKIKEHAGFLWLVEHSHVLRAEAHRSDGGPLGVVSTSAQHSEGVEFEELTLGQNGQRDLLVLIANVKDRVGDGGDITGVDGFELFISIGSRPRAERV